MSKKEQQIPAIRFKGLTDAWEQRKLSTLMDFSNGINAPKEKYGKGRKMISVMDILSKDPILYDNIRNSVEVDTKTENNNKVENGDIVFVRSSEVRNEVGWAKAYLENEFALYSGFTIRGKKIFDFDAFFVELSINGKNREQIESKAGGSTRFNVSQSILKSVEISGPSLVEQKNISAFFKKLDDTIALHQRQLDNYKELKKATLQKMFPQDGEKVPEVRFDGFTEEWEQRNLGEVVQIRRGLTYKPSDIAAVGIRVLRSSNINGDVFLLKTDDVYVNKEVVNIPLLENGDILVTAANGSTKLVGKHAIVSNVDNNTVHGGFMLSISTRQNYFINAWMSSFEYGKILSLVQGGNGAIGNLSKPMLESATITLPNDEEQTKIGNFFRQLDDTVDFYQQKVDGYQKLKNAMLQQMFV